MGATLNGLQDWKATGKSLYSPKLAWRSWMRGKSISRNQSWEGPLNLWCS